MEWSRNNQSILAFVNKISAEKSIVIRFEDLISEPEITLSKICRVLDIPFSKTMLNYYNAGNHNEPLETIDWKKKTLDPPDKDRIGRYKTILNDEEIRSFNAIAENVLKQFHYLV